MAAVSSSSSESSPLGRLRLLLTGVAGGEEDGLKYVGYQLSKANEAKRYNLRSLVFFRKAFTFAEPALSSDSSDESCTTRRVLRFSTRGAVGTLLERWTRFFLTVAGFDCTTWVENCKVLLALIDWQKNITYDCILFILVSVITVITPFITVSFMVFILLAASLALLGFDGLDLALRGGFFFFEPYKYIVSIIEAYWVD
jgi:hypothetical protein